MMPKIPEEQKILRIGEYNLNKTCFELTHVFQIIKTSKNVKRSFEYNCADCNKIYITKLINERNKKYPWLCRSCNSKQNWKDDSYKEALKIGNNKESTKKLKSKILSERSKRMWANPEKRAHFIHMFKNRDPIVYSKAKSKSKHSVLLKHWKTDKELVCVGSYEKSFVEWANKNFIDFDWQIAFKMPDNRTYIIDALIKSGQYKNTYIEIKGYMYKVAKEKWEWFNKTYVNSQLWDKNLLKKMNII